MLCARATNGRFFRSSSSLLLSLNSGRIHHDGPHCPRSTRDLPPPKSASRPQKSRDTRNRVRVRKRRRSVTPTRAAAGGGYYGYTTMLCRRRVRAARVYNAAMTNGVRSRAKRKSHRQDASVQVVSYKWVIRLRTQVQGDDGCCELMSRFFYVYRSCFFFPTVRTDRTYVSESTSRESRVLGVPTR